MSSPTVSGPHSQRQICLDQVSKQRNELTGSTLWPTVVVRELFNIAHSFLSAEASGQGTPWLVDLDPQQEFLFPDLSHITNAALAIGGDVSNVNQIRTLASAVRPLRLWLVESLTRLMSMDAANVANNSDLHGLLAALATWERRWDESTVEPHALDSALESAARLIFELRQMLRDATPSSPVRAILDLIGEFLGISLRSGRPLALGLEPTTVTTLVDWLTDMTAELKTFAHLADEDWDRQLRDWLRKALEEIDEWAAMKATETSFTDMAKQWDQIRISFDTLETNRALERAQRAAHEVEQVAESTRESVQKSAGIVKESLGDASDSPLASEFNTFADKRRSSAMLWTTFTVLILMLVVGGIGLYHVKTDPSVQNSITAGLLSLPLLALAAFTARESSRSRVAESWARTMAAQLKSVRAYAATLNQKDSDELMKTFGLEVFRPFTGHGATNELQTVPTELLKAIETLSALAKKG